MNTPKLKLFSDPYLLRQIDRPLLTKFFERFTHLLPSKYFLPNPRPDNEAYFDSLASVLERTGELPDGLLLALIEVEALAATEDRDTDPQNTDATPLSQAIQSWLRSPAAEAARSFTLSPSHGEREGERGCDHHTPSTRSPLPSDAFDGRGVRGEGSAFVPSPIHESTTSIPPEPCLPATPDTPPSAACNDVPLQPCNDVTLQPCNDVPVQPCNNSAPQPKVETRGTGRRFYPGLVSPKFLQS